MMNRFPPQNYQALRRDSGAMSNGGEYGLWWFDVPRRTLVRCVDEVDLGALQGSVMPGSLFEWPGQTFDGLTVITSDQAFDFIGRWREWLRSA